MQKNKIVILFCLAISFLFTSCSFEEDAIAIYESALEKNDTLTVAYEISDFEISFKGKDSEKKLKTALKKVTSRETGTEHDATVGVINFEIGDDYNNELNFYEEDGSSFITVSEDNYLKTRKRKILSLDKTLKKYTEETVEYIIENIQDVGTVNDKITVDRDEKTKETIVTFEAPPEKVPGITHGVLKSGIDNGEFRWMVADQLVEELIRLTIETKLDLSENIIENIAEAQRELLSREMEEFLEDIDFDSLIYSAKIDKDGYLKLQKLSLSGIEKYTNRDIELNISISLEKGIEIDEEIEKIPEFTESNTIDIDKVNDVLNLFFRN